jgi:hypothetical protein
MNMILHPLISAVTLCPSFIRRLDLAEGIALKGGVNLERLQNLLEQDSSSSPAEDLSPHALRAHSRMLPELSLGTYR